MTATESLFAVPADFDPSSLIGPLGKDVTASPAPWTATTKTYFDSFDWRLYDEGTVLLEEESGQRTDVTWSSLATARPLGALAGRRVPRFVADLPPSPMRERLAACLEMRALLPVVRIESRQRTWEIRDAREKVIARLVQECWTSCKAEGAKGADAGGSRAEGGTASSQLTLSPVKGFETACRPLVKALRRSPGVGVQTEALFFLALAGIGRRPGDYSSKLRLDFAPEMRSDYALRHTLGVLLHTLEANLAGTRRELDSEFLHDFRVAVRRARSALGQLKGILPPEETQRFRQELAWLGQVTGPKRDLDVALLKFDDYRAALDAQHRDGIDPLRRFLEKQNGQVQSDLRRDLRSQRFLRLLKDWRALAAQPAASDAAKAATAIGQLSAQRISKAYRRVLRDGGRIRPKSPAEALHELRKDCKKLRYLMEFFRSLHPDDEIKRAIKVLKGLQENLGDIQDLEVQQDQLRGYGRDGAVSNAA